MKRIDIWQINFCKHKLFCHKGQTLYYFLVFVIILVISWAMMLNIAHLIRNRMTMQNEADNIALSLATCKARVLNLLGETNYLMGVVLSLGMNPRGIQLASYSTDIIGGFPATMNLHFENPLSDFKHKTSIIFGEKSNSGVQKIKQIINTLQKIQDMTIKGYYAYYYGVPTIDNLSKDYNVILSPVKLENNLGLKRNSKGIKYYSTTNRCIYLSFDKHFHFLEKKEYKKDSHSWLVEGNTFNKQKVKVILRQKTSNNKRPLFAKLMGIKYPQILVYSAAATYNVKGSMFPKEEDTFTGATRLTAAMVEAASVMQFGIMEFAIANAVELFGPASAIVFSLATIAAGINYIESKVASAQLVSGKDNPISAYLKAKDGGWSAHLVPYGCDEKQQNK
ncbi:MAG: hypothetical protein LBU33_03180 [Endomicrobium sp.]|nr:hypothetical protein [Endomicrobium sp.]